MDAKTQQLCATIGLIYHNQAKQYDSQIKKGSALLVQTKDKKMKDLIQTSIHDLTPVRDNINKLGDFMEREFGKAESKQQIDFATQNLGTPLKKLQEYSDNCIKMKAFQ